MTTIIKVGQMFGDGIMARMDGAERMEAGENLVAVQCLNSKRAITKVLENGNELVSNIRLAADHLQVENPIINFEPKPKVILIGLSEPTSKRN